MPLPLARRTPVTMTQDLDDTDAAAHLIRDTIRSRRQNAPAPLRATPANPFVAHVVVDTEASNAEERRWIPGPGGMVDLWNIEAKEDAPKHEQQDLNPIQLCSSRNPFTEITGNEYLLGGDFFKAFCSPAWINMLHRVDLPPFVPRGMFVMLSP